MRRRSFLRALAAPPMMAAAQQSATQNTPLDGPLWYAPATVLAAAIRERRISPVELVETILARIEKNLQHFPLAGFVVEGKSPYGVFDEPKMAALTGAVLRGIPVARVGRGNHGGITPTNPDDLYIEGNNLTATKARLLLMACLMKFGALPVPVDPDNPTKSELEAIRTTIAQYQAAFDTH